MRAKTRTIKVDTLARVEGEGSLLIRLEGGRAAQVELRIFEPPRFFEAFLRGRAQAEVPDITARICGICPVAYQMSSCHAIEDVAGVAVGGVLRALRRLLYCGEWVESHALHVFMLHAPDFLGYDDALAMAKDHPDVVRKGLRIKKAGNAIVAKLGGREIHPINVRVGGFYRVPTRDELRELLPEIAWAKGAAREALGWVAGFTFPAFERDYELVALRHPDEYPFCEGRIVSSKGIDIAVREFDDHFVEEQVAHSTALHARVRARGPYLCGPLARFNLDFDQLSDVARDAARAVGFEPPCLNPFKSILARCVEMVQALDEAERIIGAYTPPDRPFVDVAPRAGTGFGASEAPRGLLYHRYSVDDEGTITDARIVPPTSQNQKTIEDDLFAMADTLAALPHREATWRAEQAVRNYDPCISCSTHFLQLRVERT
ncbi:MAG: nickel-dependent hydrogenase large subunit [Polyangiaceae bacterium]